MTSTSKNQTRAEGPAPAAGRTPAGSKRLRPWAFPAFALRTAEARPGATFTFLGFAFAVAYLAGVLVFPSGSGRIINGDAIQYFAYLQSAVVDGDLDFSNDYRQLYRNADPRPTSGFAAGRRMDACRT